MEYLQYNVSDFPILLLLYFVLNLIINGIPSIQEMVKDKSVSLNQVLNLIINGIPSILPSEEETKKIIEEVLNLIINGIPSIPYQPKVTNLGY